MNSRAVLVVGMHRSGTSAVARGLRALSVCMGDNVFDAQPDNPTGYWEDKTVVEINQRVLATLGLKWDDSALIRREQFDHYRIRLLELAAVRYLKSAFASEPLWGFKDPRTIRLLPFWRHVLRDCDAVDAYVVAVRNPRSVAASLFRRQQIQAAKAQRVWLAHMVPFLHEIAGKPFVVVDYDLLMADPRSQLERINRNIELPSLTEWNCAEIERFAKDFLDSSLRHSVFSPVDLDAATNEERLSESAYLLLYDLATDKLGPMDASFWSAWEQLRTQLERVLPFSQSPIRGY